MESSYVIAIDVHSYSCHAVSLTPRGRRREECSLPTRVPALRAFVQATPRPRRVVFEEGPLAGWLYRNLRHDADEVSVADPRRNAYIAKDGDKSDPIDAHKLGELMQGGFIKPVHHSTDDRRAAFKALVLFYHQRVRERVARANRLIGALRGQGIVVCENHFADDRRRLALLAALPREKMLQLRIQTLLADYDHAVENECRVARELRRRADKIEMIRRLRELPGIGPVRAATFYALIDTPFRFRSKSALHKYMGIGLQRRSSGRGRERVGTTPACNHLLKSIILGAAQSATGAARDNPFQHQYRRYLQQGKTPRIARRTVARSMATVMWGMWKSDTAYRPDWVGPAAGPRDRQRG